MDHAQVEVFVDDADGVEGVGVMLRNAGIVESEGDLVPCVKMSAWQAKCLAHALAECAGRIEAEAE